MSDIKQRIKAFIVDSFLMGDGGDEIEDDTSFLQADILDSTGVLELIAFVQTEWGIVVADEEMLPENLDSLAALDEYITEKKQEG